MAHGTRTKLSNVLTAFKSIKEQGNKRDASGEPAIANMAESHVQSMAECGGYYVFTHNNKGYSTGYLLIMKAGSNKLVQTVGTRDEHYNHPGGLQSIGDFLCVAVEDSDAKKSYIRFYDCSAMDDKKHPSLLAPKITRSDKGAGAAGITDYVHNGKTYHLVGVFNHGTVDFYRSNGKSLGDPELEFTFVVGLKHEGNGFNSMCLLTQADNKLFLVGFQSEENDASYTDRAELCEIETTEGVVPSKITPKSRRHMISHYGGMTGVAGVHFRYGAGLYVRDKGEFDLFASQRNFAGGDFTFNVFTP